MRDMSCVRPLLAFLLLASLAACGAQEPSDPIRGSWAPVEEVDRENPSVVLTFEEDSVVTAAGRDPNIDFSQGTYVLDDEGVVTMEFDQGRMRATLSEDGDTLRVEFRGMTGRMVRIDG